MISETHGGALAGRGVALRFGRATAEARIAGLAVAARAAAEACAAGAGEIWLVVDGGGASPGLRDDLARACPQIPVHVVSEVASRTEMTLFCDRYLVTAAGLERFARADAGILLHGGKRVAVKGSSEPAGCVSAVAEETLDLGSPRAAARAILKGTAKSSDGIISVLFNRPISQRISALLLHIPGIRPGHLTVITAALGLVMFLAFLAGGTTGLVLGGVLFHVASVVDGVDGEIARATFRVSRRGALLDTTVDMATNLLFYLGVTIALTRLYGPVHAVAGGWCVILGLIGLAIIRRLVAKAGEAGSYDIIKIYYRRRYPDGVPAAIVEFIVAITSRDFFAFGNALIILSGAGATVTFLLAGCSTVWVGFILLAAPAISREAHGPTPAAPLELSAAE
ncbi:MAG TPA: CDP-alcohol phosphatidyltransferase family protein [Allosphingosinicella sp.]|nr:CDP-alcohol phosphatidyltransferase family protein [Allosphingosinicella sp.]